MDFSAPSGAARAPRTPSQGLSVTAIAAIAACGGLLFGYDTGVISGAILFLQRDFRLSSTAEEIAVSAVLVGAILGAAAGGRMADRLGRRRTLITVAEIFSIGALLTAFSPNIVWFGLSRIIVGFAIGVSAVITPLYISEIAPPESRGRLVTFNQLAVTLGIAVAYWVDLAFASAGLGWRPMFLMAIIPAVILGVGMLNLDDTPRWYASQGRWEDARRALRRTGQPEESLGAIQESLHLEEGVTWRDLLRPGLRMALVAGIGLAVLQQFVGINTIVYYAPTIFQYAHIGSANTAILATSIVGVVNVLATIAALLLLDRAGRKPLLIVGSLGMAITLIAMGIVFAIGPQRAGGFVLIAMLLYIMSFAIGMGPVFWLLIAELFPTRLRAEGASISALANWAANLLVSVTFLTLIAVAGKPQTFWIYAFFAIIAVIFSATLVPETRQKTLEQIEAFWWRDRAGDPPEAQQPAA